MTRFLSWYQVNYLATGRIVRANVLTVYDPDTTVGRDWDLIIDGDVTEATVLAAVRIACADDLINPVATSEMP